MFQNIATLDLSLQEIAGLCAALGLLSHVAVFVRGEFMRTAPRVFVTAVLTPPVATFILHKFAGFDLRHAFTVMSVGYGAYLAALFTSIVVYRVFFHPLRHFPGPKGARVSQWFYQQKVKDKCDSFRYLNRLHQKYGEYVRVGPNLLSVADPDFVEPVHHPQSKFQKADWYETSWPMTSLHQLRDKTLHDKRRRHGWDKAFTPKSLRAYDSRVIKYTDQLVEQFRKRAGQPLNASDWLMWYAFDVMGDLAFGRAFNAVRDGKSHFYIDTMHSAGDTAGSFATMTWIIQIFTLLPNKLNPMAKLSLYSEEALEERKTRKFEEPDVMAHLLEAGPFFHDAKRDHMLLLGDARLLIVAGSDTTATTLIYTFYHIAADPSIARKLREEMDEAGIRNDADYNVMSLAHLAYMNGVINETLRMHPPVPGGVYRHTPDEGVVVNGRALPGGVKIIGPHYTIQRSPRAFRKPDEFIPERWTTQPELILNKNAWFPFSIGKFSCIGKQLALNELRTVISKLLLEFDVSLAPGEDGRVLLDESKEAFTMANSKVDLVFTERK